MERCAPEQGERIVYREMVYRMAPDGMLTVVHRVRKTPKHIAGYVSPQRCWEGLWERHTESGNTLSALNESAERGDLTTFLSLLKEIEWTHRTADEYVRAIDLALKIGAHLAARDLANQGAEIHFDSEELQKYARILAPPQVLRTSARQVDVLANIEWLKANKSEYKGKWVAIKNGQLMASADSHDELIAGTGKTKGRSILVSHLY